MSESGTHAEGQKQAAKELWSPPLRQLEFPADHVDVWKVYLDQETTAADDRARVLSSDEAARAGQFHFARDRIRYTRCRSALRFLLAEYLSLPASEIRFEYSPKGKPRLAAGQNARGLGFNVSHSSGIALIAISARTLGVDIEKIRSDVDVTSLAERFFSFAERAGLRALPDHLRLAGFFACWTRKEAFLKALGEGLSFPLADFSVTVHPDHSPGIEDIRGDVEACGRWFIEDLGVGEGFRGAATVTSPRCRLDTFSWVWPNGVLKE